MRWALALLSIPWLAACHLVFPIGMPWSSPQPDDPDRDEGNCGRVLLTGAGLADGPCETDERPAVCECDEFPVDGSRF